MILEFLLCENLGKTLIFEGKMSVACFACKWIFTPACEVSVLFCGHILHTECMRKRFDKGRRSCPSCKRECRMSHLRDIKLFFLKDKGKSNNSEVITLDESDDENSKQSTEVSKEKVHISQCAGGFLT